MDFINSEAGVTLRCPLTMEGSVHSRTLAKVGGSLIGYITRAAFAESSCSGSTWRVRTETLPWHVTYLGFTGTLPNITYVWVNTRTGFDVTATFFGFPVRCSYRAGTAKGTFARESGGALTSAEVDASELPSDQGFPCGAGELAGRSITLTQLASTTRLTVRLI
jgi:hypothetical protein